MKKIIFICLFAFASCGEQEFIGTPGYFNLDYFHPDKREYSIGEEIRMSSGFSNVTRGNDWVFEITVGGNPIESKSLKNFSGGFVLFNQHTISQKGEYEFQACIKSSRGDYCKDTKVIVE